MSEEESENRDWLVTAPAVPAVLTYFGEREREGAKKGEGQVFHPLGSAWHNNKGRAAFANTVFLREEEERMSLPPPSLAAFFTEPRRQNEKKNPGKLLLFPLLGVKFANV